MSAQKIRPGPAFAYCWAKRCIRMESTNILPGGGVLTPLMGALRADSLDSRLLARGHAGPVGLQPVQCRRYDVRARAVRQPGHVLHARAGLPRRNFDWPRHAQG